MIRYYLKMGLFSLRRNPILSALMVAAIAIGIGACMTVINIDYVMSGNPIPHRSDVLYHVQLDNWDPNNAARDPDHRRIAGRRRRRRCVAYALRLRPGGAAAQRRAERWVVSS